MTRSGKKRKNGKKSIQRLKPDEDFFQAFGVDQTQCTAPASLDMAHPKMPEQAKQMVVEKKEKNGIRILNGNEDLLKEMGETSEVHSPSPTAQAEPQQVAPVKKNKHGVVVLDDDADMTRLFSEQGSTANAKSEFAKLLEASLSGKTRQVLLREKKSHRTWHKSLSLKQRLQRYPAPQAQLDLHGYTSVNAGYRARTWVYNHYINGFYTLRIITGKGLHSEAGAVLPDVVEMKLRELKENTIVLAWEWEKKKITQSGSVTVYLVAEPGR